MKNMVPAIIAVFCIVIGGLAGHMLRSSGSADAATMVDTADSAHSSEDGSAGEGEGHGGKPAGGSHGGDKKAKGGDHGAPKAKGSVAYFKFTREFVVPLIEKERVSSLVILNINLEVDTSVAERLYLKEPVLRDSIMTTLVEIAGDGRTFQTMTSIENYETIRSMVLIDLQKRLPDDGILNVLILDMARQDL